MKGFDTLKIKSAVKARNKFDLSFDHLTTADFGEILPLAAIETVPGDKFNVKASYFSRMAPLVKPTYGKFSFKTVSAFVPYYQIADDAEAYIAGKTSWLSHTPHHRFFTIGNLHSFIKTYCDEQGQGDDVDYTWIDSSGNLVQEKFTTSGRFYVKILTSLGYSLPQGVDEQANSYWRSNIQQIRLSAYPLLAYFKLYNDYMSQSQRYNTSALSSLLYNFKHGIAEPSDWDNNSGSIKAVGINKLFSFLYLNYENDYFISAWQNPNNPLNSSDIISSALVPGIPSNGSSSLASSTSQNYISLSQTISQRALDMLRDFDNWVRRNNYSGSREVQQLYSRLGIKVDDYKANYSHVISTDEMPIQVGDVTSTADTTDAKLGEYAGKAIMNGGNGFSYECSDFGMLFIFGYFTIRPMMAYGFDRSVLRSSPLDYYTPEFDGIGADAISFMEIFENPLGLEEQDVTKSDSVYGFTERYNAYRYGRDKITGEFRNYHNTNDMNTWHTGRLLNDVRKNGYLVAQSTVMNTVERLSPQYNRIFSVTNDSVNHFYLTCHFNIDAIRPMLNLNQVVDLGEGDINVPRNGNVIS